MKTPIPELGGFSLEDLTSELHARSFEDEVVDNISKGKESRSSLSTSQNSSLTTVPSTLTYKGDVLKPSRNKGLKQIETERLRKEIRTQQKVVYGTDDRQDLYEVMDRDILLDSDSVVAIILSKDISSNGDGTFTLNSKNYGERYNLCNSEPFREQPTIAQCTGFLVDPSFIATAGHCVNEGNLSSLRFVFGYEMQNENTARTRIENTEIYRGIRIIGRREEGRAADWAIVQLDRPVLDHRPVQVRRHSKIDINTSVHVIGHPSGIPKKYADGANVRENTHSDYFVANLDTYGGNSGSPVFNSSTHQVEGILVRGETDYTRSGECYVSNICPTSGCDGEECTRTTEFSHLIPDSRTDCIPFNSDLAQVKQLGNRWKIIVNRMLLLDFGTNRSEANRALKIIHYYGFNSQCFVG
ncbi:MAG: trypsin-like peptidase domain-containing protein [Cyanothece sp. SIO2G6]|nr:trypsin-like peptidase domain-containing protein [Cyanothece sp. SIO2G6]